MSRDLQPFERRRAERVQLRGTVVVHVGHRPLMARVRNLSVGGLLAVVEAGSRDLIAPLAQHAVTLDLRLDGKGAAWLALRGRIIRTTPETIVIRFADVPAGFEGVVRAELAAADLGGQTPTIIVVDDDDARRAPIAMAFTRAGYEVIEATTPLQALANGSAAIFEPIVFAVSEAVAPAVVNELRALLAREHPHAQVITIGARPKITPAHDWNASASAELSSRIARLVRST